MSPRDNANKYLCKICNIWIADNRPQREQHESGQKHKSAKVRVLKEIAKKNDVARRGEGRPVMANTAAQQLLESVARVTNTNAADRQGDTEAAGAMGVREVQQVDGNGFPLPVDQVYGWREMDGGGEGGRSDFITSDALGEFAPDEEETDKQDGADQEHGEVARTVTQSEGQGLSNVAENEDPDQRKLIEGAFKKRVAPKSRRKRRAR